MEAFLLLLIFFKSILINSGLGRSVTATRWMGQRNLLTGKSVLADGVCVLEGESGMIGKYKVYRQKSCNALSDLV